MRQSSYQLDSITATTTMTVLEDAAVMLQCTASSSGVVSFTGSMMSATPATAATFTTVPVKNWKTGVVDLDGASIALAVGDILVVPVTALAELKVTLASGTCTLKVRRWDDNIFDSLGSVNVVSTTKTLTTYSATITADTDVVAAVTGKRIKVYAYSIITVGVNANARVFKSGGTGGTELWRVILQAPAASSVYGANLAVTPPGYLFATVAGEKLTLDVGDTDGLHVSLAYFADDAV